MSLTISLANSIRFRPVDSNPPNFDNTFDGLNTVNNRLINQQYQQRYAGEDVRIQAMSATGDAVTCRAWYNNAWVAIAADSLNTIGDYDYTEFVLDFDKTFIAGCVAFEITDGTDIWVSEPVLCAAYEDNYLKLEWFNFENDFTMDYIHGIVPVMHIEASFAMGQPAGDVTVYSNQGNETKLKELIQRVMIFETFAPDYICEQLTIAMAHDNFFVNDVAFVSAKKAAIEQQGNSNIYKFSAELMQKTVLGLNTHDTGFNPDDGTNDSLIMNTEILNMDGNRVLNIPAGYLLHTITCIWLAGVNFTIIAGTTASDDDLMQAIHPLVTDTPIVASVHHDSPNASVVYFTMSGEAGEVNLYIQLIKNRV